MPRTVAISSFVLVLPTLPVTPTSGTGYNARHHEASDCSAFKVSGTAITGNGGAFPAADQRCDPIIPHDGARRALCRRLGDKGMAVRRRARQGEEERPRRHFPRVDDDRAEEEVARERRPRRQPPARPREEIVQANHGLPCVVGGTPA